MLKILERIGKNLFQEDQKVKKKVKSKTTRKRKTKKNKKELSDKFFHSILSEIEKTVQGQFE